MIDQKNQHKVTSKDSGTGRRKEKAYLRSRRQRSPQPQVPNSPILNLGQILRNLNCHRTHRLRNISSNLDLRIEVDGVQVAHGVVVQEDRVVAAGVLGQRVCAVRCRGTVEAEVDGLSGCYGRVVGDALVDVDTGVIAFTPC